MSRFITKDIDWPAFAELLKRYADGDWWDEVVPLVETADFGCCESCGTHPLTAAQAAEFNAILKRVRELGAPPPFAYYLHCGPVGMMEWDGTRGDVTYRIGLYLEDMQAIVFSGDRDFKTYFVNLPREVSHDDQRDSRVPEEVG